MYILQKLRTTTDNYSAILLLMLDLVFTLLVAFTASAIADVLSPLVTYVISGFNTRELTKWSIPFDFKGLLQVYGMVLHLLDMGDSAQIVNVCAVFIYSNFLTSLWIWLYVLSGLVIHFGISYKALKVFVSEIFRVTDKPLSVLGWICILVVSVIFWGIQWIW